MHPDYRTYVGAIRPLTKGPGVTSVGLYMALVRQGTSDPTQRENAPFAGAGAMNDIVYDPAVIQGEHSAGWVQLLLEHEYFHARHLAGATSLPLPSGALAGAQRHYFEAAAWGFNVAQARAGAYPGLRQDEFREALDRYGDHFRALREVTEESAPATWTALSMSLREPVVLLTRSGSLPQATPARLSDSGRGPAIP